MKFRSLFLPVLALFLSGCISLADDITPPPGYVTATPAPTLGAAFPPSQPDLQAGAAIYTESCAPCHGASGLADGPMAANLPAGVTLPKLAEISTQAVPANWYGVVTQGRLEKFMPPFADKLDEQARWNVVAYALTLGQTPAAAEEGAAIYASLCFDCHGENGEQIAAADLSNGALSSGLSLENIAATTAAGVAPSMPGFAEKLTDEELLAVAAYTRSLAYGLPSVAAAPAITATPDAGGAPSASETEAPTPTTAPSTTGASFSGDILLADGSKAPDGLTVVLHGFDHQNGQFAENLNQETKTQNGRFAFDGVEAPQGRAFYVSVDYSGATYTSEPAFIESDVLVFDLPVTVFETTTDTSALVIEQAHLLLNFENPGKVMVIQFLVIANDSDKTVVAETEGGPVVKIDLPQGFSNLQFEDGVIGDRFVATETGFADTLSVSPSQGEYQLVFAFELPYEEKAGIAAWFSPNGGKVSVPVNYPAKAVSVLVPEGVKAEGAGLTDEGIQQMGNNANFQMYNAGERKPGDVVEFTFSGSPAQAESSAQPASDNATPPWMMLVGGLGLALIVVGVYLFWRDRAQQSELDEEDDDGETAVSKAEEGPNRDEILDAILALDDQYRAGNLPEEAYRERRAALKAQLN